MLVAAGSCLVALALARGDALQFVEKRIALAPPVLGLDSIDRDGDGRRELVVMRPDGLDVVSMEPGTTGEPKLLQHVPAWSDRPGSPRGASRALAWCVAPAQGRRESLWLLQEDGVVLRVDAGSESAPVEIVRGGAVLLPGGISMLPFARDLDGDGRTDLALPAPEGLQLWFGGEKGMRKGPLVRHRVDVELGLPDAHALEPSVSASVRIPSFECDDQNGDGHPDLAFASSDRMQFFWSAPDGSLPEKPTLELDLAELREKLRDTESGVLDPSNLLRDLRKQVRADVRDLDGDGHADLLLRQGARVAIYAGSERGIDRSKAAQVLKTSGNLVAAFAVDDNGDGKLDLCMLQVEDVSIGEALLWAVAGGSLKLDLFTYFQEERLRFARSPSKRRTLVVQVPALLRLSSGFFQGPAFERLADELARLPVELDLEGRGARRDVAVLRKDGAIEIHRDVATRPAVRDVTQENWRGVLERYDALASGKDSLSVGILDLVDWVPLPGARLRAALQGKAPAAVLAADAPALPEGETTHRVLFVMDVDGDGRDDLLLAEPQTSGGPLVLRLFTRAAGS